MTTAGGISFPLVEGRIGKEEEKMYLEIEKVYGREILDSRGNPTVEAEVTLIDGTIRSINW